MARSSAPPGTAAQLTSTVEQYYGLVNAHHLSQSFSWLTPAYQHRIGFAYYQSFWNGISRVDVLSVQPGNGRAALTLRYDEANGSTSTESVVLTFTPGAGHLLIDTYQVS